MLWHTPMILVVVQNLCFMVQYVVPNDSYNSTMVLCTCLDCLVDSYVYLDCPIDSFAREICYGVSLHVHKHKNNLTGAIYMIC